MADRLQKLLSQRGIASRRQAEKLILDGRVTVNGELAELGQRADIVRDVVCVDGVAIGQAPDHTYLLLHKPRGVVSTCRDPQGRKTVLDLLDSGLQHGLGIHPVGRLDADSTGALLLTNDGELTHRLTHPSHQMPKVYRVWVEGVPSKSVLQQWRNGVLLEGRKTLPASVVLVRSAAKTSVVKPSAATASAPISSVSGRIRAVRGDGKRQQSLLQVTLTEGRNRQIRRVAEGLGHPVTALHRAEIGSVALGKLPRGRYRLLEDHEVAQLKKSVC
ncbi:MAG: pseudouridine synthase [Phormidesmis sp.]